MVLRPVYRDLFFQILVVLKYPFTIIQVVVVELADPLKHGVAGTEARLGDQTNAAQVAQYPIDRRFIETGTVVAERRNDLGDGHVSLHFAEDLDDSAPGRCGPKP